MLSSSSSSSGTASNRILWLAEKVSLSATLMSNKSHQGKSSVRLKVIQYRSQ